LSIVTFNYDRSIDFRLHKYVECQFGIPTDEAWKVLTDAIPIVHVHGTLGEYPKWPYGDKSSVWERGQDIQIVSEVAENTPEFQKASELLNDADRVVVIGFGFAEDNVRRLQYFREQDNESRDVIIIPGSMGGPVVTKEYEQWVDRWGLKQGKHWWNFNSDNMFTHGTNPFN
jgi:hypothetical protein